MILTSWDIQVSRPSVDASRGANCLSGGGRASPSRKPKRADLSGDQLDGWENSTWEDGDLKSIYIYGKSNRKKGIETIEVLFGFDAICPGFWCFCLIFCNNLCSMWWFDLFVFKCLPPTWRKWFELTNICFQWAKRSQTSFRYCKLGG